MNVWIVLGIAALVIAPPALIAYALCKVASDADDAMYDWDDIGRRD